jgi:hypothetical protein
MEFLGAHSSIISLFGGLCSTGTTLRHVYHTRLAFLKLARFAFVSKDIYIDMSVCGCDLKSLRPWTRAVLVLNLETICDS